MSSTEQPPYFGAFLPRRFRNDTGAEMPDTLKIPLQKKRIVLGYSSNSRNIV